MESDKLFQTAYDLHYKKGKYDEALELYNKVIEQYPNSKEAGYAQNQIVNIDEMRANIDQMAKLKHLNQIEDTPKVILTTAPFLEGYNVTETINIITSECVFGMNIFRDILASFTDVLGGRSKASQQVLKDARETCLSELRNEASSVGANAVIAINLDYNEFSGGGKSMLFLVASGTAVKVEKIAGTKKDQNDNQSQAAIPNVAITHEEKR